MPITYAPPPTPAGFASPPMIGPGPSPPQAAGGYNGAVGQSLSPLVQALMKAKMQERLRRAAVGAPVAQQTGLPVPSDPNNPYSGTAQGLLNAPTLGTP